MGDFERESIAWRLANTQYGDTLQLVAARELGDASRWPELIWLNGLSSPYITNDQSSTVPNVIIAGAQIRIPASRSLVSRDDYNFETDCLLTNKLLSDDGHGDFLVVSGSTNLKQQLQHKINTPRGQATRHPDYGCLIWHILGTVNGETAAALGSQYVKTALLTDYRLSSVKSSLAKIVGDAVIVTAVAVAIDGKVIELS
ncbi:baseplate family protein [Polynucleobacter sp.]|uniref:baseplate family protein n=1 Tax=Polynucleobacter sp. TaxID=2029855 RepID=UPI003F69650B